MNDRLTSPSRLVSLIDNRKLYDIVKFTTEKELFSLMDRPVSSAALSGSTGMERQFLEYVLEVLVRSGYVEKTYASGEPLYFNAPVSREYLSRNSASYAGDDIFYDADTCDILEEYVREGPEEHDIGNDFWTAGFLRSIGSKSLMGHVQDAVEHVDLTGRRRMLDIGGGHGLYSIFFTKRYPELKAWVLDLPVVLEATGEYIRSYGSQGQVMTIASDYHDYEPEATFDTLFISNLTGSYDELHGVLSKYAGALDEGGIAVLRSYCTGAGDDYASAMTTLDRYMRRGKKGLDCAGLISVMKESGYQNIKQLYEGRGVVILKGVRQSNPRPF